MECCGLWAGNAGEQKKWGSTTIDQRLDARSRDAPSFSRGRNEKPNSRYAKDHEKVSQKLLTCES